MNQFRSRISVCKLALGLTALVACGAPLTTSAHAQTGVTAIPAGSAPAPTSAQSSTIQMSIDSPADGLPIVNGTRVLLGGWAGDAATVDGATSDSSIDTVKIYLDGPMESGTLIGTARTGGARPDVASQLGVAFLRSGFDYAWTASGVGPGQHVLFVYAHSTASDSWAYRTVTVNGPTVSASSFMSQAGSTSQTQGSSSGGFRINPYQGPPTPYGGSFLNNSLNNAANYLGGQNQYGAGYGGYYPLPQPCNIPYTGAYPITGGMTGSSTTGSTGSTVPPSAPPVGGCASGY